MSVVRFGAPPKGTSEEAPSPSLASRFRDAALSAAASLMAPRAAAAEARAQEEAIDSYRADHATPKRVKATLKSAEDDKDDDDDEDEDYFPEEGEEIEDEDEDEDEDEEEEDEEEGEAEEEEGEEEDEEEEEEGASTTGGVRKKTAAKKTTAAPTKTSAVNKTATQTRDVEDDEAEIKRTAKKSPARPKEYQHADESTKKKTASKKTDEKNGHERPHSAFVTEVMYPPKVTGFYASLIANVDVNKSPLEKARAEHLSSESFNRWLKTNKSDYVYIMDDGEQRFCRFYTDVHDLPLVGPLSEHLATGSIVRVRDSKGSDYFVEYMGPGESIKIIPFFDWGNMQLSDMIEEFIAPKKTTTGAHIGTSEHMKHLIDTHAEVEKEAMKMKAASLLLNP